MPVKLSAAELDAWQALLHAHHLVWNALESEMLAEHGLTLAEYDVLVRLARAAGRRLRMRELAQRVMISPSGLTRVVDGLVRDDLVERCRDGDDARVVFAQLTSAGLSKVRTAAQTHLRGIRRHFTSRLTDVQLRHLAGILQVIAGPHEAH